MGTHSRTTFGYQVNQMEEDKFSRPFYLFIVIGTFVEVLHGERRGNSEGKNKKYS